jgi:hypothetical protein
MLIGATFLSMAGVAVASPPRWLMDVTALPVAASPGSNAGYTVTITNQGPSNISQLFLVTKTTAAPVYVDDSGLGRNACSDAGVQLTCNFGALNAGDHVTITVAYIATGNGTFDPGFEGNSNGATYTDPKRSHGDTLIDLDFAGTSLNANSNFRGSFNINADGSVSNNGTLNGSNKQSTAVGHLPPHTAVTVLDGPNLPFTCTPAPGIDCSGLFGEWSEIHVGTGGPFAAPIVVQISFKSGTPTSFYHRFDNGDQQIIPSCPNNAAPSISAVPCFTWDGHNTASIYTLFNGIMRGK